MNIEASYESTINDVYGCNKLLDNYRIKIIRNTLGGYSISRTSR